MHAFRKYERLAVKLFNEKCHLEINRAQNFSLKARCALSLVILLKLLSNFLKDNFPSLGTTFKITLDSHREIKCSMLKLKNNISSIHFLCHHISEKHLRALKLHTN